MPLNKYYTGKNVVTKESAKKTDSDLKSTKFNLGPSKETEDKITRRKKK